MTPPEDRVISMFAGLFPNHDRTHSLRSSNLRPAAYDADDSVLQSPVAKCVGTTLRP
jgi:hypothetical protein